MDVRRHATRFVLLIVTGLILVRSRELDAGPPTEGAAPAAPPVVRVIDAGTAPRGVLRYRPKAGTGQTVVTEVVAEGLSVRLEGDVRVERAAVDGDFEFSLVVRRAEPILPKRKPGEVHGHDGALREGARMFVGSTTRIVAGARGETRSARLEPADYLPPSVERSIAASSAEAWGLLLPLPEEAVGVGATWEVVSERRRDPIAWKDVTTYRLARRDGEELEIRASTVISADPQPYASDRLPPGTTARVASHRGTGTATSTLHLDEASVRECSSETTTETTIEVTRGDKALPSTQRAEARISVRSGPAGPAPAPASGPRPAPPTAAQAAAVLADLCARVRKGTFAGVADLFDVETIVRTIFGSELDALSPAEREETYRTWALGLAKGGLDLDALSKGIAEGLVEIGEATEVAPPRGSRILVSRALTVRAREGTPPGPKALALVVEKRDGRVRVVEVGIGDEFGVFSRRVARDAIRPLMGTALDSPLVSSRNEFRFDPHPPGGAETRPPGGGEPEWASPDALRLDVKVPVVAGVAADAPRAGGPGPWGRRFVVHVDHEGRVWWRAEGKDSPLTRLGEGSWPSDLRDRMPAYETLAQALSRAAQAAKGPGGKTDLEVLVRADADATWADLWPILGACVRSDVGVRRIAIGVARAEATAPVGGPRHGLVLLQDVLQVIEDPFATLPEPAPENAPIPIFLYGPDLGPNGQAKLKAGTSEFVWRSPPADRRAEAAAKEYAAAVVSREALLRGALAATPPPSWRLESPAPKGPRARVEDWVGTLVSLLRVAPRRGKVPVWALPKPGQTPPQTARGGHRDLRAGGGKKGGDAIENALRWLAAHQSADGRWEAAGFHLWCDGKPARSGPDGQGKPAHDVGVTGLSLLAFLRAGYTNRSEGPFGKVVGSGLAYLKGVQDAEGCFGPRTSGHFIYGHAIATQALVEAYATTGSDVYREAAQKGLDFITLARNPYFVWRYGVKPGDNDTSVTGWMLRALEGARIVNGADAAAGKPPSFRIDPEAFDAIRVWVDKLTDRATGRVGYDRPGGGPSRPGDLAYRFPAEKSESMTGVGVLARLSLGEDPRQSEVVRKGAALLAAKPPRWNANDGSIDMIHWYFGTLALHRVAGEAWRTWQAAIGPAIVDTQRQDTDACLYKGSWDPLDVWGSEGGRVYATALMALTLEVHQNYDRATAGGR